MVEYGTKLFGKVDHVPGVFYVATQFHYVGVFPLVPGESYLVLDGSEVETSLDSWWESEQRTMTHFRGVPIRLSGRSVLAGYLRAPLASFGGLIALFGAVALAVPPPNEPSAGIPILALGGALILLAALHRLLCSGATVDRAIRLARAAGIPKEIVGRAMGYAVGSTAADEIPATRRDSR